MIRNCMEKIGNSKENSEEEGNIFDGRNERNKRARAYPRPCVRAFACVYALRALECATPTGSYAEGSGMKAARRWGDRKCEREISRSQGRCRQWRRRQEAYTERTKL